MLRPSPSFLIPLLWPLIALAQQPAAPKPTEHILGSISAVQADDHSVAVKDDKSGQTYVISLANTKTLLKVAPGAKDLQQASRITEADLAVGDRVDVRGFPGNSPSAIQARSLVLMSGRDLAAKHESEAQEWQNSSVAKVTMVNPAEHLLQADLRTADGTKSTSVQVGPTTEFLRYDPKSPKTPAPSDLASIQVGDQVHIINNGGAGADGSSITALKIYSAPVRTVSGTIVEITPNPSSLSIKDPQTQKTISITLTDTTVVRRLPAEMAAAMKGRAAGSGPAPGAQNSAGQRPGEPQSPAAPGATTPTPRPRRDFSKMLERLPVEAASELKAGDAVIVSGFAAGKPGDVIASTIVAGVEGLLQQSSRQGGRSMAADWGMDAPMPTQ